MDCKYTRRKPHLPLIVLVNDDGRDGLGLEVIRKCLAQFAEVLVVVPEKEQSGVGHSISLHDPLRCRQLRDDFFTISGTPTDCVIFSQHLLAAPPTLLVSGINQGQNLGDDVTYSGTVAAAIEGTLMHIPSVALSLVKGDGWRWETAAVWAEKVVQDILALVPSWPEDTYFNVNIPSIPATEVKGLRMARQGRGIYRDYILERKDPRGGRYFWIDGEAPKYDKNAFDDFTAVAAGYVSITPLGLDMTNHHVYQNLQQWSTWDE